MGDNQKTGMKVGDYQKGRDRMGTITRQETLGGGWEQSGGMGMDVGYNQEGQGGGGV